MSYGAEIEKPIINPDGSPGRIESDDFLALQKLTAVYNPELHFSDIHNGIVTGVDSGLGSQGLDNGNLVQESALGPVKTLQNLEELIRQDLNLMHGVLGDRTIVDLARYPGANGTVDWEIYRRNVAPKGIYPVLWARGWDHTAGFEGQTQNSPSTGIEVKDAAMGVSVMFAADAAISAIFGNSPRFDSNGKLVVNTSRTEMWDKMFGNSVAPGDRKMSVFPDKPFLTLADYFQWMWGKGTGMFFVLGEGDKDGYKGIGSSAVFIDDNPSVLDFLSRDEQNGYYPADNIPAGFPWATMPDNSIQGKGKARVTTIKPTVEGVQHLQFMNFGPARWRFALNAGIDPKEFTEICNTGGDLESLLKPHLTNSYIEGRTPCANFPSQRHAEVDDGVRNSLVISPSALQAGLLTNPGQNFHRIISRYSWTEITSLRETAIARGMEDPEVQRFSRFVFNIALERLSSRLGQDEAQRLLRYPEHVIDTGMNGSSRAAEYVTNKLRKQRLGDAFISLLNDRALLI